jgi:hypothetical protein
MLAATMLLWACYSNRPAANRTTSPDYNKRVDVTGAHTVKRGNALNVTFQIGLIGAGAYGGYNMDLIQRQTENGREPVRTANAAVGAVAGAGLGLLVDYIAGKNKTNYNINPQEWIKKANGEYLYLNGNQSDFQIIHPSAEQNYTVRNIQDAEDFSKTFPGSSYVGNVVQQALTLSDLSDIKKLSDMYPQ